MEAARQHAIQTGAKKLTLETTAENRKAWLLYESLGAYYFFVAPFSGFMPPGSPLARTNSAR